MSAKHVPEAGQLIVAHVEGEQIGHGVLVAADLVEDQWRLLVFQRGEAHFQPQHRICPLICIYLLAYCLSLCAALRSVADLA